MPVVPIVLGLGALWLFFSDNNPLSKNLANPAKAPAGAPGPGAQGLRAATGQGGVQQFQGPNFALGTNAGSPNSTLVTLNNGIVIANNAMGFADQLGQYFGSNEDSEYPVADSYQAADVKADSFPESEYATSDADDSLYG